MKIGLVIQGPLSSRGLSGKTYRRFGAETEDDIVTYDCVPGLLELIGQARGDFHHVVCATWASENPDKLRTMAEGLEPGGLLALEDHTPFLRASESLTPKNNHFRQFYSTLRGVERL